MAKKICLQGNTSEETVIFLEPGTFFGERTQVSQDTSKPYAKKVNETEYAKNTLSRTVAHRSVIGRMTRARPASCAVVTSPPLDLWIEAVRILCESLVQKV